VDAQNDAIAALAFLAPLDKAGQRSPVGRLPQDRVIDAMRAQRGCEKADR
jgi:hypothetical protein